MKAEKEVLCISCKNNKYFVPDISELNGYICLLGCKNHNEEKCLQYSKKNMLNIDLNENVDNEDYIQDTRDNVFW